MLSSRLKGLHEVKKEAAQSTLKKNLGVGDLIMLGLGAIIGTGIFVLTGLAAAKYAGPAITVSFILGAIACIFTALAYAELSSMLPVSGGGYSYSYVTLGEPMAAFCGWTMIMVFTFGASTVAAGWSGYVVGVLASMGVMIPEQFTSTPLQGGIGNFPAMIIVLLLSGVLMRGGEGTTKINGILVVVKILAIFLFIAAAIPHVQTSNWINFAPNGVGGICQGAGFIFMAYTGFDVLGNAAEECKNPNRDLPIGIIVSLVGSAILYVVVSALLTAIVPYASLDNSQPMAYALRQNGITIGASLVAAGAIAGMTTVLLTQIYGQSRLLMVMARDGLMLKAFTRVHPKFATPYKGILVSGLVMSLISGFFPVATLGQISSMATLLVFTIVSLAVMVLRINHPNAPRTFRCPAVYLVASLSCLMCLFLFTQLLKENWAAYLVSSLIGVVFYFAYGMKNSLMNEKRNKK